jgi:hypothetical protein
VLDVRDATPYGGGSYVGGRDRHACPAGEDALRIDGLWHEPYEGGPIAWAGFESNQFPVKPGREYELTLTFRVSRSSSRATVEFLPAGTFDLIQGPYRLDAEENEWASVRLNVTAVAQRQMSARLKAVYTGYGTLWLCDVALRCVDCDEL